jgi:hypothetical protein
MVAAGIILYGLAFVLFLRHAGNTKLFGLDQAGLGLACCALFWFLKLLIPVVT